MNKNTHINGIRTVISPAELQIKYEPDESDVAFICESRKTVEQIVAQKDKRLLVVVGPCSIHDYETAVEYARQLQVIQHQTPNLFLVMRVYFEKPRSRTGWKGFIYDPDLDNTCDINKGLELARKLLLEITKLRIPIGCEFLDLITPQYLSDMVSWGAIGARTSESQTHRQLTSGLSMPVGFKNLTDGDVEKAINGIISAYGSHSFLGIDDFGKVAHISTTGNPHSHLILRGGKSPNYQEQHVESVTQSLKKENISTGIIIDCSHGNSQSYYQRQSLVAIYVKRLRLLNRYPIVGIMLESNLRKGNQKIGAEMQKGVSVTDACIDIQTTQTLLTLLNSENYQNFNSLGEIRKVMRTYDAEISKILNTEGLSFASSPKPNPNIPSCFVMTPHIFEQDKMVAEMCDGRPNEDHLAMIIACRFALSEKVADLKYRASPYAYLHKNNDFLKLITDREIEKANLRLFPHQVYLKIMDVSKEIQVQYLEKLTHHIKIGYLFGKGTFSEEAISKYFRGTHVSYPTFDLLKAALETKQVDFILIPTYNSLIGEILQTEAYWETYGTVDHRIELCLYSNTTNPLPSSPKTPSSPSVLNPNKPSKYAPQTLYLEPHVQKEAENYIQKNFTDGSTEMVIVNTSKTGCIRCIKDSGERASMTISSKNNNSNFLHLVEADIVDHNITTFSLIGM